MADFATTIPVAHGLWRAPEKFLGLEIPWEATPWNYLQEMIVYNKAASLELAAMLGPKVIRSEASNKANLVNRFLREEGFNIQLTDQGEMGMLYVASVMKLLGRFFAMGETGYWLPIIKKPAFRLGKEANVRLYKSDGRRVAEIPTRGGFSLLVTRPTESSGFHMISDWHRIISEMKLTRGNGVVLPMAKVDEAAIDVKALVGMSGGGWQIMEAIMAAKFALTPQEVKFESAFAYSARKGVAMRPDPEDGDYVADHPLYFALAKHGHLLPLAVGHVGADELYNGSELS